MKTVTRWQAIVFDLDDTLFPEREYVLSGFQAVANWAESNLGVSEAEGFSALRAMFEAGIRGDTFTRWLQAIGRPATLVPELVQVYRSHRPTLQPYPGIAALLERLSTKFKLGLVSDGYLHVQQSKFRALGLANHFDAVVFSDEWGREAWKPSVRPFQEVLIRLGVPGDACVYVADNPLKDFLGARSVGMTTIRALHCAGEYSSLDAPSADHEPHLTVTTLDNLQTCLLGSMQSV